MSDENEQIALWFGVGNVLRKCMCWRHVMKCQPSQILTLTLTTAPTFVLLSTSMRSRALNQLRRWRQIDIQISEATSEAKDNVKYLQTLEKFIEPLYTGTPETIIDTLPALLNSIKMIHTIARYYNTTERMTGLFVKITNQCINVSKKSILADSPPELL